MTPYNYLVIMFILAIIGQQTWHEGSLVKRWLWPFLAVGHLLAAVVAAVLTLIRA